MRQLLGLLKVIKKSETIEFYTSIMSYRTSRAKEVPSLEQLLELTLNEGAGAVTSFDEKTDKFLEDQALKRLNERRQNVQ